MGTAVRYIMDVDAVKKQFGIIGNSEKLNRAVETACIVAGTDLSVLITGETGVGKESFSKIIHFLSKRKNKVFVSVNCGAIPEGTIDSELFGHEKGAFTGAVDSRKGYFEEALGGSIFLDEVGEMPLQTQVKLLRVLENSEIFHVGSSKSKKIDVRVIAATNVNLLQEINNGNFREDLYYRLNTVQIVIPPLRDRDDDISTLFLKFSTDFATKYNVSPIRLTDDAKQLLKQYQFPGNVRQLKNIVEQISAIEQSKVIKADVLEKYIPTNEQILPSRTNINRNVSAEFEVLYKMIIELRHNEQVFKNILFDIINNSLSVKDLASKYSDAFKSSYQISDENVKKIKYIK